MILRVRKHWLRLSLLPVWVWVATAGAAGGATGLGVFTFVYGQGLSYMSSDPGACVNCHVMRDVYEGWGHSSHGRFAVCNDCHLPHNPVGKYAVKALNGWNHSVAFTTGKFHDPIMIKDFNRDVVQHNCVRCHEDVTSQMSYAHSDDPTDCLMCHRDVGHSH